MRTRQLNGAVTPCIKGIRPLPFAQAALRGMLQQRFVNALTMLAVVLPQGRTLLWGPVKLVQGNLVTGCFSNK